MIHFAAIVFSLSCSIEGLNGLSDYRQGQEIELTTDKTQKKKKPINDK